MAIDPSNLEELSTLIRLSKCHDIDHEAFLLGRSELD